MVACNFLIHSITNIFDRREYKLKRRIYLSSNKILHKGNSMLRL